MANQNQNPIGNSGSLEDCHTNLYALTDIAGIQYKKFISNKDGYVNSLDDPILVLYTKCLQSGILSSWNKSKKDEKSNLSDMSGYIRELWIFWYDGNDPFALKNIIIPNSLKEDDHGNWKNGLTYEIRSILFKALNTNFERYFLTKGFVRMGPWIQMPYRLNKHSESQYGFNVKFFLHGESTICGAIDVRNVSMVRQITMKDLLECNNHYEKEVLLSPYAVRACITGRGFKDDDTNVKQLYEEWLKYYPLVFPQNNLKTTIDSINLKKFPSNSDLLNSPPKFIEITTGSCKMRYPSCLVCVKIENDNDDKYNQKENRKRKFNQLDVPDGHLFSYAARRFSDRILKEIMIPLNKNKRESNEKSHLKFKSQAKPWKYCNPFWKGSCTCKRSTECKNMKCEQTEISKTGDKTFHRKLQNFEIPFTKTLFPKDNQQFDFNLNKQISVSRLDLSCDRSTSPTNNVSNDPIMPTLSPQLPSNSDSSFPQQLPVNTLLNISTSNSNSKLNSGNFLIQSDSNHFPDFNEKINKTIVPSYNQALVSNYNSQNTTITNSTINSRTPPPPSITPISIIPNNFHNNKADVSISSDINQVIKSESLDSNYAKNLIDSLPSGIEINQKPVISKAHVATNISVVSKPSLNMKSTYFHSTENISDVFLFPPIANNRTQSKDFSFNYDNYNKDSVNCSSKFDDIYQMSLINNSWLTSQSLESSIECPEIKKLKTTINFNRGACNNGYDTNQPIQELFFSDSLNKPNTSSTKSHRNYVPASIEKNEKTSLIPDQIFDDSDEDENSQRLELSYTKSYLSPNNSQLKILRASNPYKFSGTSLLSSGGAGCVTAMELSLMYPTPPSLEGVMTSIGSPIERQRGEQMLTPLSSFKNPEINFNENQLKSLSMCGQNWDEIDKDWSTPPINSILFSSGLKYSKKPEIPKQMRLLSFNHRRLQYQRSKLKRQIIDPEQKIIDRFLPAAAINSLYNHSRRPNNLGPSTFYPQMNFPPINFGLSRFPSGSQRFSLNSGQNSAPITPASVCTNPPSVESSIGGTPRNIDYHNPSSTGFSRPQVVQSSPIVKSPRIGIPNQHQLGTSGPISSCSINHLSHTNINSLYFNVLLSDSILNVYKDHNFDSCNICICSMSVMGNDVGLYIEDYQQNTQQSFVNRSISTDDLMNGTCSSKDCKCGFSAIRNRHYAINANLFYEDEVEITGIKKPHIYSNQSNSSKDRPDIISKLYGAQILSVYDEFGLSFLLDFIRFKNTVNKEKIPENLIEFQDYNAAICHAFEQASESSERAPIEKDKVWLSKLYYFKKDVLIPKNYNDQIRLLMTLRPLLQEAVSNTRLLESSYTVDGPLTWKTFHRLAGRGNVESCEPQPLPKFQVFCGKHSSKDTNYNVSSIPGLGSVAESNLSNSQTSAHNQFSNTNNGFISAQNNFNIQTSKKSSSLSYFSIEGNPLCLTNGYPEKEKECITISPYAVREWDKLNLEPIFRPKEIAYAIVTPTDSGKVLQKALITYFKELNNAYQGCRLGHHFSFRSEGIKDDIHSSFVEINTEYWNDKGTMAPTLQPASLQKHWLKELSKVMSTLSAEDFISKLVWYVKQCEVQTIAVLGQYGVNQRNGSKSTLFPTCDNQKKDTLNINQTLELLLSPGNGCGQLSKVLNTKVWSSDKDVYLTIYVINPFAHGQDISEPTYRLSNQWMNKLCHKISKSLHPSWKSRVTFQLLSINKIFDATQFGANVGVGDNDGSSIGGRDSSATSSTSCTSSSVSWSIKWCRQWNWKSTAFAVYNSVRRKIGRVGGLQSILNGKGISVNLCSSAKCSMARGCSSDDECESAASLINANRCQTKCGPTGFNEKLTSDYLKKFFLESQDQLNNSQNSISIYAPPYILAPSKSLNYQTTTLSGQQSSANTAHNNQSASESWGYIGDKSNVLFVAYCLSFDQKWLLATCTDLLGTVLRQVQINIIVPQLHLRKIASPRKIGLGKLWDFIQEVVSDSCQPWRVVIGRLGRAGHGELKSWNGLLSRQNLIGVNQRFRDECGMCHVWNSGQSHGPSGAMGSVGRCDMCALQIPTIISGCFVSLECHSSFRIFPGSVKPEERASSNLPLCTPRDVSVTHILVFPTSTSAGAVQNDQDLSGGGGGVNDMNLEELLKFGNEGLEELGNISNIDMTDNIGAFSSEFDTYGRGLGSLLPRTNSNRDHDLGVMDPSCGLEPFSCYPGSFNNQEDGQVLMQQPLAMGYYLSTTEPGPLPSWFYTACPPLNSMTDPSLPSCFKAALHLQTSLISQEDGSSGLSGGASGGGAGGAAPHPLDSHQTSDVLRFVLESYHALSWLTFDPSINDRRSCLPIHFLFLAQLYEADQSFM